MRILKFLMEIAELISPNSPNLIEFYQNKTIRKMWEGKLAPMFCILKSLYPGCSVYVRVGERVLNKHHP